ncbi:hypothetical protein DQ04_03091010 [Trypanosoma grayi]|uniref:hypothetical protein n=1 Tax=Trypanosoma grayi TaxID=71804 RepID=UPI0004F46782|nr:hypothetical protein DQ04_03091010 [Trypanosoma grayi]KEG10975.1 hypothetical protein DQ04_03091010 [Trypanosoma grayi]
MGDACCGRRPTNVAFSASRKTVDHTVKAGQSSARDTVVEQRRQALQQWMKKEGKWGLTEEEGTEEETYLRECWEALNDPARVITDDDLVGAINYLDSQCEVKIDGIMDGATSPLQEAQHPPSDRLNTEEELAENAFLVRVKASLAAAEDIERQLRFQRTLLDFREVMNSFGLSFFLCCGTALGAHREGYFIPHDNDIDVGVFYEDLQRLGSAEVGDMQLNLVSLLSHIALDSRFVLFDICGTVERGLELRLLHHVTRVSLDLNVYYPPLAEDAALVSQYGPFVWAASHYEDAAARRHGMYRYRHAPFRATLQRMPFCDTAAASGAEGFAVVPQEYLLEYFGADWRTPRKYAYAEGLRNGDYKNIIEE